ncbi:MULTISPECIES: SWIM zinc finger family protein [Corynebacterium]|uniref:SWIM zinc finger family protein n=1 Tax=Corynebacterium TaxID=1716 RepID=UPI00124C6588
MPRYTSRDNVIYANFGAKRHDPQQLADTADKNNDDREWLPIVSRFIVDSVERDTDPGRKQRGRDYAREDRVTLISYSENLIAGQVRGSRPEPFEVQLRFAPIARRDQRELWDYLVSLPDYLPAFLRGELDRRAQRLLGFSDPRSITGTCECPDSHPVCKHIVAVAHAAAAEISRRSYRIFDLRGWDPQEIEAAVLRRVEQDAAANAPADTAADAPAERGKDTDRSGSPDESAGAAESGPATAQKRQQQVDATAFWQGGQLPPLPDPKVEPALDDSDLSLLHIAMRSVSYTSIDELRAITDIEDMYYFLTHNEDSSSPDSP